ncbi:glycosyltransferase [Pseudomonas aeruginosa]
MRCTLVIPTRNAGAHLDRLLPALVAQRRQPDSILVVDSRSSDDTVERFRAFGARVEIIEPASFNHGGTRRWASQQVEADALIYLTQDAIPASPDSFANLLDELYAEADIGVAYGRQLPHPGAGLLGAQARRFNYPPESRSKRLADASELGIKTCFSSDSFSAYRSDALAAVGGFLYYPTVVDMAQRRYDHWFWATVQAVSGVYLCWALSGLMMKIDWLGKAMTYIGQSTLILLIFHGEIQHKTFNLLVHLGLSEPAAASVALVISVIVSLLIGEVIKRVALLRALYFPFPVRKKAAAVQGGGEAR